MFQSFKKNPIFHLASMARSGETVILRSLAAHSKIKIVHNLNSTDAQDTKKLFEFLKTNPPNSIKQNNAYTKSYNLKKDDVLLLKQGVWEHKYDFDGFILSRNPVSIFASLKVYDKDELGDDWKNNWYLRNTERLTRWLKDIDKTLLPDFEKLSPIDQFSLFYNRRMGALLKTGKPIVYYENFVQHPEKELRFIISEMGLHFEETVLNSHENFKNGEKRHGKIDLSKPIQANSLSKYQKIITKQEFDEVHVKTKAVSKNFGYSTNWNAINIIGD